MSKFEVKAHADRAITALMTRLINWIRASILNSVATN